MNGAIKVHTIGDSTMAEYDESTTDKRGWGMYLGSFFDPAFVTVNNRGKSGADTRGFYTGAAYWPSVKSQMSAGDYLIIQFAHNDEGTVTNGLDNLEYAAYCEANSLPAPTDARGTNPQTTYRDYLRFFIDEARALGVNPILVGPICRKYFSGNSITRKGQHDLGDKFWKIENGELLKDQSLPASDSAMSYVHAMREVAKEKNVPFLNLTEETRKMYIEYGEAQCTQLLFCNGDNTHTNAMGGNLIARQAAQMLKEAGILADHITIPTSITANPTSIDIGETYSGIAQNKEFLLTGFGLEPASGTVSLNATGDLMISTDKENYAKNATVNYAGSTLFQKIFVRVSYTNEGAQNDSIVVSFGNNSLSVPVTAIVISMAGGSAVSATWSINSKPVPDAIIEGPISAALTMSHMLANDTKPDFIADIVGTDTTRVTLVRFHNADDSGAKTAWPDGEIDENPNRYIDFAVTAPHTMEIRLTGISMDIAAHSTSVMSYHINIGFGDTFSDVQTIAEKVNMPNLTIEHLALTPIITIPAGETLHVRILPWHNNKAGNGKYIGLRDVKIEGMAFEPSKEGIENTQDSEVKSLKILENGQLIIIKNGVKYNAQGGIVK